MPLNTPLGLPYPEVTDRVADGWDAIRDLAVAADTLLAARATTVTTNALDARLDTIEATNLAARLAALEALTADTGWIAPTLTVGWTNYAGFNGARYRKKAGIVYIEGLLQGAPGVSLTIFTLPAGFRPAGHLILDAAVGSSAYVPEAVSVRVNVTAGGTVSAVDEGRTAGGGFGYQSISNLSFPADA